MSKDNTEQESGWDKCCDAEESERSEADQEHEDQLRLLGMERSSSQAQDFYRFHVERLVKAELVANINVTDSKRDLRFDKLANEAIIQAIQADVHSQLCDYAREFKNKENIGYDEAVALGTAALRSSVVMMRPHAKAYYAELCAAALRDAQATIADHVIAKKRKAKIKDAVDQRLARISE